MFPPSTFDSIILGNSLMSGNGNNLYLNNVIFAGGGGGTGLTTGQADLRYYPLTGNPSGFINLIPSTVVQTSGTQTISGKKTYTQTQTFVANLYVENQITGGSMGADFSIGAINDGSKILSVDIGNRQLNDATPNISLDWQNYYLNDPNNGQPSLNWHQRNLYAEDGTLVGYYGNQTTPNPYLIGTWQVDNLNIISGINSDTTQSRAVSIINPGGGAFLLLKTTNGLSNSQQWLIEHHPDDTLIFYYYNNSVGYTTPLIIDNAGNCNWSNNILATTAGAGFRVKEGSNAKQGTATLVLGSAVVSNTSITNNSRIFLSIQSLGTVSIPTAVAVTARTAGTSFTITSAAGTDTSIIAYEIFEPA